MPGHSNSGVLNLERRRRSDCGGRGGFGSPPGTVTALTPSVPESRWKLSRSSSSHGWGVAEALTLGRVFQELPPWLIIYGIEGQNFGPGQEVSQEVATAVPEAARRIQREIQMWLGRNSPKTESNLDEPNQKMAGIFPAQAISPSFAGWITPWTSASTW